MLKIELNEEKSSNIVQLTAKLVDGELVITDEKEGWSLVGLCVVDNKISLVRYTSIGDTNYNTDKNGKLVEVPE